MRVKHAHARSGICQFVEEMFLDTAPVLAACHFCGRLPLGTKTSRSGGGVALRRRFCVSPCRHAVSCRRSEQGVCSVSCEASKVDFSAAGVIGPVAGLPGAEDEASLGGPNHCWACPQFIEILLELADVEENMAAPAPFTAARDVFAL
eukprot:602749-Amphidinium_carterae.1